MDQHLEWNTDRSGNIIEQNMRIEDSDLDKLDIYPISAGGESYIIAQIACIRLIEAIPLPTNI